MLYLVLFLDIILSIFFLFIYQFDIVRVLLFFIIFLINSFITILLSTGIQCFKPLFAERQRSAFFNTYLIYSIQFLSFFITFCIYIPTIPYSIEASLGLLYIIILQICVLTILTMVIFIFGIIKIEQII